MGQCEDLKADRRLGKYWERQFCLMAADYSKMFTAHQIDRTTSACAFTRKPGTKQFNSYTLPDVTIWTAPGEHHEIKHKDPAKGGRRNRCFGLEVYRFEALCAFMDELSYNQGVYYTIHRHDLNGGRESRQNMMEHWFTVPMSHLRKQLAYAHKEMGLSWVSGVKTRVPILYWNIGCWVPLRELWEMLPTDRPGTTYPVAVV